MEEKERKIVKEQGKDGEVIYHYSDFNEEVTDSVLLDGALEWRIALIMSKLKCFLSLFDDDGLEKYGFTLSVLIKEADKELNEITDFLGKSIGEISILYKRDIRYENYEDASVAGLILRPRDGQGARSRKEVASCKCATK